MTVLDDLLTTYRLEREAKLAALPPEAKVPGDDDLAPRVLIRRDGKDVALVRVKHAQADPNWRDTAIYAARTGALGFCCDEVVFVMDAHMKVMAKDDYEAFVDGYEPGDMQRQCHDDAACTRGEISDVLMGAVVRRDGTVEAAALPYFLFADERRIEWRLPPGGMDGGQLTGYVVEGIKDGFEQPTMMDIAKAALGEDLEVSDDELWLTLARMSLERLVDDGWVTIVTNRRELVE